jgi:hypothetical protein
MADSDSGYKVGPGRPPLHTRFKFGGCSALSPWSGSADAAPRRPNLAGWPRRTRRQCSSSLPGCGGRSCTRSEKRGRRTRPDSPAVNAP